MIGIKKNRTDDHFHSAAAPLRCRSGVLYQLSYISKTFCQRHKTKRASIAPLSKLPNRIKDKPRSEKRSLEWSVRLKSYQVAASTFLVLLKL